MLPAEAARVLADEPCAMFVGSGISIPAPSNLISAKDASIVFLSRVGEGLVTAGELKELVDVRGVLPEFVYGLAERHFGSHVYDVWGSLESWRAHDRAFSANAGHLAAVHVAARSGTPILTPNFDTFLEDAAERLGLAAHVTVAVPGRPFDPAPAAPGQVAIWKLHGTAVDPTTVFSSVRTLTSPIPGLREHLRAAVPRTARLVLAGYSGRDLDLFPVLADNTWPQRPMWVDLEFAPTHRAKLLVPSALEVAAPFDLVGRRYAELADERLRIAVAEADLLADAPAHTRASPKLKKSIEQQFVDVAGTLHDETGRRLMFGELFINAGMSRAAVKVLTSATSAADVSSAQESERVRLLAKAHWELGEFRSSVEIAEKRASDPIPSAERDALRFAITAAEMRSLVPPAGLPGASRASRRRMLRLGLVAGVRFLAAAPRAMRPGRVSEPTRTPLAEGWVEHGIRLAATLQLLARRPDGSVPRLARAVLRPVWRMLSRSSQRIGYAEGVGNAGRYLARLSGSNSEGDHTAHEFLGHFLGIAIAHRDAAWRAVQGGDLPTAREEFDRGLKIAQSQDDPVLMLTFEPLAEALGVPFQVSNPLVGQIQADWAAEHLAWRRSGMAGQRP